MKRYLPFIIIGGLFLAVVAAGFLLLRPPQPDTEEPFTTNTNASPAVASPANGNRQTKAIKSPANVSVTVEEYGDYQCPPCGQLHPEMKRIQQDYGSRINFVFHNLPLIKIHKNALFAAQAAEAARLQDRFWQMHDLIYETQNAWKDEEDPRPTFTGYARKLGLDLKRFAQDMDGTEVQQRISEDQQRAGSLSINGTPTILVEGSQLKVEVTTGDGIRKGIELMLARKAGIQ